MRRIRLGRSGAPTSARRRSQSRRRPPSRERPKGVFAEPGFGEARSLAADACTSGDDFAAWTRSQHRELFVGKGDRRCSSQSLRSSNRFAFARQGSSSSTSAGKNAAESNGPRAGRLAPAGVGSLVLPLPGSTVSRIVLLLIVEVVAGFVAAPAMTVGVKSPSVRPSCPAALPATSARAPRTRAGGLVVPGPTSLLLCSYYGGASGELERSRLLHAEPTLTWLVHAFDALRSYPAGTTRTIACGADDGSADLAVFAYAGSPDDIVTVGLSGCATVTNGHISRTAALTPGPALLDRLANLVGWPSSARLRLSPLH